MKMWMKYVKPYWPYFILGPICMIIEVIGEVLMPRFLSVIIDYGIDCGKGVEEPSPFAEKMLALFGSNWAFVLAIMVGMILTAVLMMLGGVGGSYFGTKASVNFAADLRADVYKKVQSFSFANIDRFSTGSLVTRLTNDVTQMQNFVLMLLRMALRSPGILIGALIMAISVNPSLTVILAVTIPLLLLSIAFFIFKGFSRFSNVQTKIDGLNSTVQEDITNIRVVKSFVREEHEKEKFAKANSDLKKAGRDAMLMMIMMSPIMSFFMNATTIAVMWFGGNMVISKTGMSTGDLSSFIVYITQILSSLMMVTMMFMMMSRAMASGKRIAAVLNEKTDISDETAACPEKRVESGRIEFRNVSFRYYKTSEEKVLDDITFTVESGETIGIIGSTGCGKTTIVSMIPRLYDADEGEILVDGVNVRDYSLYNLREGVGMVLQKNVLFSGTVADNLHWGDESADLETLKEAASHAQADGFISAFKDGYDYSIDQGGTNISGGQKQRLCIARALLKKPKILILDDSTSAVDTATEARIRQAFRTDLKDSTKIIIAQRITSVMEADKIMVINEGRITGIGSHEELLRDNLEYQEIYNSQMDKKEGNAV